MAPTKVKPQTKPTKKSTAKTVFKISKEPYDVALPKGFNFKDFKPLKKKNFTSEALYFEHRAAEMAYKKDDFLAKAVEARKYGSTKERRQKKQVIKLQDKMTELKEQLTKQGIDVDAILKVAAAEKTKEKKEKKD